MKRVIATIVVLVIIASVFTFQMVKRSKNIEEFAASCDLQQIETRTYLQAISLEDISLCEGLELSQRCKAVITKNPKICKIGDLDCNAFASQNISKCNEPLCKAIVSQNVQYCKEFSDPKWCEDIALLNFENFGEAKTSCKLAAKEVVSNQPLF